MQARCSRNSPSPGEPAVELEEELSFKLKISEDELGSLKNKTSSLREPPRKQEKEGDEEFSFACTNSDRSSSVFADDIFLNGKLRPIFPSFSGDFLLPTGDSNSDSKNWSHTPLMSPVKKLFVETEPNGPCCEWTGKPVHTPPAVCKKSNSTGFSKLWRLRELLLRSNSDGKDAFVFLHHHTLNHRNKIEKSEKAITKQKEEKKRMMGKTLSSPHERLYVMNRAIKEERKQKSYLPYRVGLFTNMSGLSRNVHPY